VHWQQRINKELDTTKNFHLKAYDNTSQANDFYLT
jgi:hypothetical protein